MRMSWGNQDKIDKEITQLLSHAESAKVNAEKNRIKNIVDPFSSLLIASTFKIKELDTLEKAQRAEAGMRALSNALGTFHQGVLGSIDGWVNHDAGYDLECDSRKIIAEVKNKWNTMNATTRRKVEDDLETAIRQKSGNWTAYLVQIIPRKPERYKDFIRKGVFEIDGASFYEIATGEPDAIHNLFNYLCSKIAPSEAIAEHCREIMFRSLP